MSDAQESPESLAGRVADGQPIDWERALRGASDDQERRIIGHLRLVESIAQVHRGASSEAQNTHDSPTITAVIGDTGDTEPARPIGDWGHLELREKLGEGGFGEVYRAWDRRLDREVALKLIKAEGSLGRTATSRFVEEGRLLAKLRHPNVVTVYGAEVHDGRVGLWMEFIRGRSLEQLLHDQGPFGPREAALVGIDLCRALAAVHRAGVVHRDVKAQNAMREEGGRILLTDFGAGIEASAEKREKERTISGTPFYMASELLRGEPASQRSDIYSLGVLLYRIVTGSYPIEGATWKELKEKHARREAKLLRDQRPDLPEGFVAVVERATAWSPAERFATAGQMEQALAAALGTGAGTGLPVDRGADSRRRRSFVLGGAGLLAAAAVVVGLLVVPALMRRPAAVPAESVARVTPASGPAGGHVEPLALTDSTSTKAAPQESAPSAGAGIASTPAPYTVEAALYRVRAGSLERDRLEPGAQLALGDRLTLEFKASAPLHVYIINEDEVGHSYALFPLPGLDQQNPLAPGTTHVLPGSRDGKNLSWTVDSPGGREHMLVLASPARLIEFEAEMNALARAGQMAVSLSESAKVHLRGIGGLDEAPAPSAGRSAGHLFEMAQRLASRSEVVRGVWMRRIDLENPHPE